MKKKIVLLFSAIILSLVTLLSACADNGPLVFEEINEGSPYSYITDIGEVVVIGTKDTDITQVVIPQTYNGKPVTIIGGGAFDWHRQLTDVEIPEGIKYIGDNAFNHCDSLTEVTLPDSLVELCCAFEDCSELQNITIGKNIKYIWNKAFKGCIKIQDVYYNGTQEDWSKIKIMEGNECLLNAEIHFAG